ncbi:SCO2523 family variant P-loop protein [Streptosporangium subroseum]|uniref:SCO2523 family variant P-loop protein n=1 Tax=Streptosporangium subroseum TaxID=106412 RepID=UPI003086178C|nr:SCO2523 family variant P-loop protein [Streptosporangium subroseum]
MLVISTSDKGGTGRSVTTCNVAYRRALLGDDVCYLDFDFGSPTSGAIFGIEGAAHGTDKGGLHQYLQGELVEPHRIDVWAEGNPRTLGARPSGAGRLVLFPGDGGGGEFNMNGDVVERCAKLLMRLQEEFDICLMDLSAGRSHAAEMVLTTTARPEVQRMGVRWLVFHRWTRQHVAAASGLVYGNRGLIDVGKNRGHLESDLLDQIRFVRTAVVAPDSPETMGLRATQEAWLRKVNEDLNDRAIDLRLGRSSVIATVPLDPVLQWREQLITDQDIYDDVANAATVEAFRRLAEDLDDNEAWARL